MTTLLIIIYIAFISLGLPDTLLGSAWPVMRSDLSAPLSIAGYIAMTTSVGTVISSLISNRLIGCFGVGKVTAVSTLITALSLLGYACVPNVWILFILSIPLGLGAGCIDAALNNFVAMHYSARHMSWLHCFWGVGATVGPVIMGAMLTFGNNWRKGYGCIGIIQLSLSIMLFAVLPLWKRANKSTTQEKIEEQVYISNRQALKLPGIGATLAGFMMFSVVEGTGGLWAASYVNAVKGMEAAISARASTIFYGAITVGRLISGFATAKFSDAQMVRFGQIFCVAGALTVALSPNGSWAILGVGMIGLGTSPIYPSMLHETPRRFGSTYSQAVIGLEMACNYIGGICFPPLFGQLANWLTPALYPWYILMGTVVMIACTESAQRRLSDMRH